MNIKLNNNVYPIPDSKLAAATTNFISHLGTIAGSGLKVTIGGVEYGVDSAKVTGAIAEFEGVLDGMNTGSGSGEVIVFDGDLTDKEYFTEGRQGLVKMSDEPFYTDAVGSTLTIKFNGEVNNVIVTEDMLHIQEHEMDGQVALMAGVAYENFSVVTYANEVAANLLGLPSAGTYFWFYALDGATPTHTISISCLTSSQ